MNRDPSPYRSSIWKLDPRYTFDRGAISEADYRIIERLALVDVAKKQVPPVPVLGLLAITRAICGMPPARDATISSVTQYLEATTCQFGAGIPTSICMLAVMTDGAYAPVDRKFVAGMRAKKKISAAEEGQLNGKAIAQFATIYVEKVLPAWTASLEGRTPEEADNYWGSASNSNRRNP